ncbi:CRISPR-associated protein, TM1812 family [Cyclonatronum proteinivorum]|uniref:CRISPR-associated protein, TM1812 family n=1 Tax=Cyclonatronum proteinivorum TaxID=1457365 RepID=A0A345UPP7_9BACT|nr:TIGR02221 family CRISPR-associated protein [Cyclonatronum proteinivorum]AXJ02449.1 CRISPR-associated protein, TM1812 family [Cyclonatronum proteinivorum]
MGKIYAISFLGTSPYSKTIYVIQNKSYHEVYIQNAIKSHYKPEKHFIFATSLAKEKHEQGLLGRGFSQDEFVQISDGKTEAELWEIFSSIVETVPSDCRLVIDVTHGFRIQPMVALAVVVFLRFHKNISVEAILYGLYDHKNEENEVLDITSFLDIIDWTFGIRRLMEKGDASDLAGILSNFHRRSYLRNEAYKATGLSNFGNYLNGIMSAMAVVRPYDVISEASRSASMTEELKRDIENMPHTQPLGLFADQILQKLSEYAAPLADVSDLYSTKGIKSQLEIIDHYISVAQYQQALTLINELLIGFGLVLHVEDSMDLEKRKEMSYRLNAIRKGSFIAKAETWEYELVEILKLSVDYRNDVNHAGMRPDPKSAKSIVKQTKELAESVRIFVDKHLPAVFINDGNNAEA